MILHSIGWTDFDQFHNRRPTLRSALSLSLSLSLSCKESIKEWILEEPSLQPGQSNANLRERRFGGINAFLWSSSPASLWSHYNAVIWCHRFRPDWWLLNSFDQSTLIGGEILNQSRFAALSTGCWESSVVSLQSRRRSGIGLGRCLHGRQRAVSVPNLRGNTQCFTLYRTLTDR